MHYGDFSHWLGLCMFLSDNYVRNCMSRHAVNAAINSAPISSYYHGEN